MDIVYVCRRDQTNEHLRYSLRTLENLPHDNVFVVGGPPRWLKNVKLMRWAQPLGEGITASRNTTKSLEMVCANDEVSDNFIYMNDDFFVLKPLEEVPLFHRGPIQDLIPEWVGNYRSGAEDTQKLLCRLGHNFTLSYELHIPFVFNKKKLVECLDVAEWEKFPTRFHKRTFYANYWSLGGEYMHDVKYRTNNTSVDPDATFASSSAASWGGQLGADIKKLFPEPSPYEV